MDRMEALRHIAQAKLYVDADDIRDENILGRLRLAEEELRFDS